MVGTSGTAPLRLLFVGSSPRWGGDGRWLVQAARGLAARGHEVHVVTPPHSKVLARAAEAGLRTHVLLRAPWRAYLQRRRLLATVQPDAVFIQRPRDAEILSWCAWPGPPPPFFLRLGAAPTQGAALARLQRRGRLAGIFTSSRYLRAQLQQKGLLPENARTVRDGVPIDAESLPPDREALRRRLKLPRKGALVLHVGHLHESKGQETSLRALATLRIWRPGAVPHLAFLGTGPDEARLHDLCHELGLKEHVIWVGFRTDVASYLQAADLLVLPSRHAVLPWTLLEAMAHEVPVIAAAVAGVEELVETGHNGLLVPPDDPTALADTMTQLLDGAELARRLGRHGRETVSAGWNEEAMLDELEAMVRAEQLRRRGTAGALFVDRDDTLVRNVPYNGDPDRVELLPGAARALRWVNAAGIPVVVVSNQSGIAQGLCGADEVEAVHVRMRELLQAEGAAVDAVYFCPHHPEHGPPCACRKPEPGLLLQAAQELRIDVRHGLMVGNAARDLEAGRRAGCAAVGLVLEGASTDLEPSDPAYSRWTAVVRDFLAALSKPDGGVRMNPPARAEAAPRARGDAARPDASTAHSAPGATPPAPAESPSRPASPSTSPSRPSRSE